MLIVKVLLGLVSLVLVIYGQNRDQANLVKIFHTPQTPNMPVIMAPDVHKDLELSNNARFTWTFDDGQNRGCTTQGRANVRPCEGRVVDYSFNEEKTYNVTLTITDSTLREPLVIQKPIQVFAADKFQVARRPEIRNCDGLWLQKWYDALYRLKELGVYDHLIRIHIGSFSADLVEGSGQRSAAHSGPSFLPWHRLSMRVVERCIATAVGDDSFGLPYWDWTQGIQGLDRIMGPNGDPQREGIITSGPFCQDPNQNPSPSCPKRWELPEDYPNSVKSLVRQYGSDPSFHFSTQAELDALLNIQNYDAPPFNDDGIPTSFRNALEGWAIKSTAQFGANHNGVHRYFGGTMGDVIQSFNDPYFIIHHCQVDRLFTMWQKARRCENGTGSAVCYRPGQTDPDINENFPGAQRVSSNGQTIYAIVGHMYNSVMFPWNVPISSVLRAEQGYVFLGIREKPPAPRLSRVDDTAEPLLLPNGTRLNPNNTRNIYPVQGIPKKKKTSDGYSLLPVISLNLSMLIAMLLL